MLSASSGSAQVAIPEPTQIAVEYFDALFWLWLLGQIAMLALPIYLLISGRSAAAAAWLEDRFGPRWLIAAAMFCGLYALLYSIIQLPMDYLRVLALNPYFGRPIPDLLPWAFAQVVPIALLAGIAALVGWGVFALIRWSRNRWWAWASGGICILVLGQIALQPVVADMQSDLYVPVQSSRYANWQSRLEAIASRAGAEHVPVVVWQTTERDFCRIQNSVVGLGPTRRVVLADQIFNEWDAGQVEVAFAHELKHYLFDNTWVPVAVIVFLSFSGGLFVYVTGNLICRRWGNRARVDSLAQAAALPLIVMLSQIYTLAAVPAFNLTAQYVELEADRFALELTRNNDARARVSADQCGQLWLPEDTLHARLYLHTHPSVAKRIRLANDYRPWDAGGELVYGDVISFD